MKRQKHIFATVCRALIHARKTRLERKDLRAIDSLLWTLTNMKDDITHMNGGVSNTRTWTFQKHFLSGLRAPRYTIDMNAAVSLYEAFYLPTPKRIPADPISVCISAVWRYYLTFRKKGRIINDHD